MSRTARGSLVVFALMVVVCSPASAQGPTSGSILGTVTDATGGAVADVRVTCRSPAQMGLQTTVSNDRGRYGFPLLVPGIYQLTFERPGFTTLIRKDIFVSVDFAAEVNAELDVAMVAETHVVAGDSPLIDTQNTTIQSSFTSETLKALPSARDLTSIIGLLPATIMSLQDVGGYRWRPSRRISPTGNSACASFRVGCNWTASNTTDGGISGLYFDYGAFDEVRLGTSSDDASMPNPGLQVNAVLKSGGNQLRGEAYIDFGDDELQADNVDERQRRQGIGRGTRIRRLYDPNVNVGGPIKRDRLWFFTSVRHQYLRTVVAGFPVEEPERHPTRSCCCEISHTS